MNKLILIFQEEELEQELENEDETYDDEFIYNPDELDDEEEDGDEDDLLDQYDEDEPPKPTLKRKGLDLSDKTKSIYNL